MQTFSERIAVELLRRQLCVDCLGALVTIVLPFAG